MRNWAGLAGCAWAVAYIPIHLYWAATGSAWPFGDLLTFEPLAYAVAGPAIVGVGLLGHVLTRRGRRRR